jgi:hypothetical protein
MDAVLVYRRIGQSRVGRRRKVFLRHSHTLTAGNVVHNIFVFSKSRTTFLKQQAKLVSAREGAGSRDGEITVYAGV